MENVEVAKKAREQEREVFFSQRSSCEEKVHVETLDLLIWEGGFSHGYRRLTVVQYFSFFRFARLDFFQRTIERLIIVWLSLLRELQKCLRYAISS